MKGEEDSIVSQFVEDLSRTSKSRSRLHLKRVFAMFDVSHSEGEEV